jgi:hypothetical protein
MLRANRGLRLLLRFVSTGRLGRALMLGQPPGLDRIDSYYYSAENVDRRTISRFYGYTLENPGRGALKQLDHFLEFGHLVSADRRSDYSTRLGSVRVPILVVAGEGDVLADMPSILRTYDELGSRDKTLVRVGRRDGQHADYGHCDLVWSRYAPLEIFPAVADWLDSRQPGAASAEPRPSGQQVSFDADLRPGFKHVARPPDLAERQEPRLRQP